MSGDSKVDFTNLATIKEFCKTLVKGGKLQTQDDLYGADGIIKLNIPRDRVGSFGPIIIAKHQKRATIIDYAIIGLCSKG